MSTESRAVPVAGFDARLNQLLAEQAEKAGETVDTFIRRAVVTRLVEALKADEESDVGQLLRHLQSNFDSGKDGSSDPSLAGTAIHDPERLRAVEATGLLDTDVEERYDRLAAMASDALSAPGAAISLLTDERQFFKSAIGLPSELDGARDIPLELSMCKYVVNAGETVVVEDARLDPNYNDHAAVTGELMVSYLGIPLSDNDGHAVGTLCVWDQQPRQWTTGHVQLLQDLAWIVRERIFE
ncbi:MULTISPECIES: GAF domain-containing protein [unclassified Rhodococcus (in: high G+C Gram-positive bacteria)]|uniref:GAF domain-containing protein n=1 Tax=unclassified Rhodococcus (in: high G+C Gram-positive bacteria) TaxID=192944 RepID=UPI0027DEAE15|nr:MULTISPECIES: GAF domain-containing protein [unclassified Rhodococcus (in: high G+C Gram-positive bacteria)]